jgi:predicted acetyltransferase
MLELALPDLRLHRSYLAAYDEFLAAGEQQHVRMLSWPADDTFPGREYTRASLESDETFADFAASLRAQELPDTPRPQAFVACSERWLVVDGEYVGRISLRHELTDLLLTWGGHIGYSVRPSARRRGYATQALAGILPLAASLGIDPVLVTCDVDNAASRRTIERNGGVYEDTREGKLRFWVPTR